MCACWSQGFPCNAGREPAPLAHRAAIAAWVAGSTRRGAVRYTDLEGEAVQLYIIDHDAVNHVDGVSQRNIT